MTTPTAPAPDAGDVDAALSPVLGQDPDAASSVGVTTSAPSLDAPPAPDPDLPPVGRYKDEDGRVYYASRYSKRTRSRVESGAWQELGAEEPAFDPAKHNVAQIVEYLERHAGDQAEVLRVKAAEVDGKNRVGVREWEPDQS